MTHRYKSFVRRLRTTRPNFLLRACAAFAVGAVALASAPPANAQSPTAPTTPSLRAAAAGIEQGNRLLEEGRYEEALAEYEKARASLPDSAEVAYDRGIALYRLGRYSEAEKAFQDALEPGNLELEAKAKYNLGRSAHAAALEKKDNLPDAINDLGRAISFYNDALQIIKDDADAKLNKEAAERLRAYLEKLLAQQQQQQQEQKDNPTSQPNEEPASQPNEPQPSSQPSEEEKNKQDQGQEGDQEQEGEQEQQSNQDGESKEDQQKKDQKGQSRNQDKSGDGKQGQQQQAQAKGQEGKMSEEEAEPMLQEARDAERQRREANRMRMMRLRGRIPVRRDW